MTISTPITLAGGTLYTDNGSYVLDALNVTAASTLTMKWRKGLVMRRFWSSGDLAVVNNPGTDSDADPANGARFTFLYPNEAGSADAASEYTGTLTASFANTPGTNQYMILKAGAANTFSAATVKVASKHIDLLLGNDGKTLTSGTVIFTNVAVQGASFGEEATWTLNGGTLQWGDGGTNALSAGASTFLGGSVEVKGGATLALHPWESKPSNGQMVTVSTPITLEGSNDALAQKIAQAGQDAGKTVTEVKVEEGCSLNGLELFEQVLDIADSGVATVTYDFGIDWMDIVNNKLILCAKVQQSNEAGAILPDSTTITLQSSTDNGVTWQTVTAETVTAESLGRTANAGTRYLRVEKPTQSTRYRITASNTTNN